MKHDVTSKSDIEKIVNRFYEKVKNDKEIGFFFTEVIAVNWEKHLPLMYSFWENVLFYTGEYNGIPLVVHRNINSKHPISERHFERWLQIFDKTIDEMYEGDNANKMKRHSKAIATVMKLKI